MKYNILGKTGLKVSELCFGTLPLGPLQNNMSTADGGILIRSALESGVNFIDTAQIYKTYPHILAAIKDFKGETIITTKSVAETYEDMKQAIIDAQQQLNRDYIDIFLLHAARASSDVFETRAGAWECILEFRQKGIIRAAGIAAHSVKSVEVSAVRDDIDVIFPIINSKGMGILEGTLETMLAAIKLASDNGKALYAMKSLAGGALINEYEKSINYIRELNYFDSIALGMSQEYELSAALKVFNNEPLSEAELKAMKSNKRLLIMPWCSNCLNCVDACPNDAFEKNKDGKVQVNFKKCVLCGYCVPSCSQFALRLKNG